MIYQAVGPHPRVVISKKTTFITSPLANDGLPNYSLAILQRQREGVTSENNGAILFWRAKGPCSMKQDEFTLLYREIGLENVDQTLFLVDTDDQSIQESLKNWVVKKSGNVVVEAGQNDWAERISTDVQRFPWTIDQLPPLGQWVTDNQQPLDWLVEAAKKPAFFSPSPKLLKKPDISVVMFPFEYAQATREAVKALTTRAMYHTGNGDFEAAWRDCLACWRLGSHVVHGPTFIEKLVGKEIRKIAQQCTVALLDQSGLPDSLAHQVLSDLNTLPKSFDIAAVADFGERLMFLDSVIRISTNRIDDFVEDVPISRMEDYLLHNALDPNVMLRLGNEWYDRVVKVLEIQDRRHRLAEIERLYMDMNQRSDTEMNFFRMMGSFVSRGKRSQMIGEMLLELSFSYAVNAMQASRDADEMNLELVRLAAALAVYRQQHGQYPIALAALMLDKVESVPLDLFTGKPLFYEQRGEGYLLYSAGRNQKNDSGTNCTDGRYFEWKVAHGEWVDQWPEEKGEDEQSEPVVDLPSGDDMVIRLPLPPLKLPLKKGTENAP